MDKVILLSGGKNEQTSWIASVGDLRSDRHADEVALDVIHDPELFELLLDGLKKTSTLSVEELHMP